MTFNLKNYQQQVLDRLEEFFALPVCKAFPPLMRSLPNAVMKTAIKKTLMPPLLISRYLKS